MTKSDKANLLERELNEWGLNEESPEPEVPVKDDNSLPEMTHKLTELNREILDHIEEFERESVQATDTPAVSKILTAEGLDWGYTDDVSEEFAQDSTLSSVIKNFEEEIDSTMAFENSLRDDVQEIREKISCELAARSDLETKAGLLESQAEFVEDLRKEIHPTEEDKDRISKSLDETQIELKSATGECNVLTEKLSDVQEQNRWIQSKKSDLQEQESALNERVGNMDRVRQELSQTKDERDLLDEKAHELERQLETTNNSVKSLEPDIEANRKMAHDMRSEIEGDRAQILDLRKQHDAVNAELSHVRARIDSQVKFNRQLEAKVKTLTGNYEAVDAELSSARKALGRFHRAAIKLHHQTREIVSRPYPRA